MTIPISPTIINVTPGVLAAAGEGFDLVGMVLTNNTRVPIGQVESFDTDEEVGDYFGLSSHQFDWSEVYFAGYTNATKTPGSLNYVQYNPAAVAGWVRGGPVGSLTLQQLQALTGTLEVVVDGYTWNGGSISLSSATSYSSAASIIQEALIASPPDAASGTGVIAAETAGFTASIQGNVMYVTAVASGELVPGGTVAGTGVTSGTVIDAQLSGTANGIGTYAVNNTQNVVSEAMTSAYGQLTISGSPTGEFAVGQTLAGAGVAAGTVITGLGTGTGGTGTYFVGNNTAVSSTTITAEGTPFTVTYDSISEGFVITSGVRGPESSVAFPTGSLVAGIFVTAATGAIQSPGAAPATPNAFMSALIQQTQNWATFTTDFDPDGGPGNITQKLAFSLWNSQQNNRFLYVEWDSDPNAINQSPGEATFGYQVTQVLDYSGTSPNWEPSDQFLSAFVMGMVASINFEAPNGRITAAFKSQEGLTPGVTSATPATNLAGNPQEEDSFGNGYNFYGAYATANQGFIFYNRGTVSGEFTWFDTYVNQIWLNQSMIGAIIQLLTSINSIPYNQAGYTLIDQALIGPINEALNAGVIRAGVTLSSGQIAEVNQAAAQAAGSSTPINIASTISQRGWYLQILDAPPAVRQSRGSPPITLWYCDGESVQAVSIASIVLQ